MKKKTRPEFHFAVCVSNEGYKASLEIGKLYRLIPDEQVAGHGYVRIIDESGEDYAYSTDRFFMIEVPQELEKALSMAL